MANLIEIFALFLFTSLSGAMALAPVVQHNGTIPATHKLLRLKIPITDQGMTVILQAHTGTGIEGWYSYHWNTVSNASFHGTLCEGVKYIRKPIARRGLDKLGNGEPGLIYFGLRSPTLAETFYELIIFKGDVVSQIDLPNCPPERLIADPSPPPEKFQKTDSKFYPCGRYDPSECQAFCYSKGWDDGICKGCKCLCQ